MVFEALPHIFLVRGAYTVCRHRRFLLHASKTQKSKIFFVHFALDKTYHFHFQVFQFDGGIWVIESLYFEVSRTVWTVFLLLMTLARLNSAFFCLIWVLFPMLGRLLLERVYDKSPAQKKQKGEQVFLFNCLLIR
jgi:hypothetical protein